MKTKANPIQPDKKIIKIALILVIFVIFTSIVLIMSSLLPEKKAPSLKHLGSAFSRSNSSDHREFRIESKEEGIYNLGEYKVNIDSNKLLTLNISVKCLDDASDTLFENSILIQNAVLTAFDMQGGVYHLDRVSGKERIKQRIKENIYETFGHPLVEEIYFNKFLIL